MADIYIYMTKIFLRVCCCCCCFVDGVVFSKRSYHSSIDHCVFVCLCVH